MLMFSWEYLFFRMNNTSLTVLLSFFHDIKLTFEISVFCTCSWIWSLTCWEHHHWKRWGQLVKAPRHTYSGVLINRYCWRLLAFLALGLDYPSLSLHSVGFPLCRMLLLRCHCVLHLDCILRLGRKKRLLAWHGMYVRKYLVWISDLRVVSACKLN